jgi:hypothetical protein
MLLAAGMRQTVACGCRRSNAAAVADEPRLDAHNATGCSALARLPSLDTGAGSKHASHISLGVRRVPPNGFIGGCAAVHHIGYAWQHVNVVGTDDIERPVSSHALPGERPMHVQLCQILPPFWLTECVLPAA